VKWNHDFLNESQSCNQPCSLRLPEAQQNQKNIDPRDASTTTSLIIAEDKQM
jgi:hypothetical protein